MVDYSKFKIPPRTQAQPAQRLNVQAFKAQLRTDSTKAQAKLDAPLVLPKQAIATRELIPLTNQPTDYGLVDPDFIFDESQLAAMDTIKGERYGCMMGAAGTGKTTCTKALVQHLAQEASTIDANYYENLQAEKTGGAAQRQETPSILLCSFTGRAVRQIKKNFPVEWHKNIQTIHRALRFAPEMVDVEDSDGNIRTSRQFVPTHTEDNLMPWDIVIIDEASMLSVPLWHQFYEAMKPGICIYMVGDLNQLPPTHGRSIFGYALDNWPVAELTHVHRQKDSKDAIVPNAHRILNGELPTDGHNVKLVEISQYAKQGQAEIVQIVQSLHKHGRYNEHNDAIVTAINGDKWTSPNAPLGQIPLNEKLAYYFNAEDSEGNPRQRVMIDAGRSRKVFAVGDKVMVTKNDYEKDVTNGMMGIITEIEPNSRYMGDMAMVGDLTKVQTHMAEQQAQVGEMDLDSLTADMDALMQADKDEKVTESFLKGAASHTITVDFLACESLGDHDENSTHYLFFAARGEVESLQLAYASTCHKLQGAEAPTTIVIAHEAFGGMLCREWLYTACTRASEKMVILFTRRGLSKAVLKQRITGNTIKEKAASFRLLQESSGTIFKSAIVHLPPRTPKEISHAAE